MSTNGSIEGWLLKSEYCRHIRGTHDNHESTTIVGFFGEIEDAKAHVKSICRDLLTEWEKKANGMHTLMIDGYNEYVLEYISHVK